MHNRKQKSSRTLSQLSPGPFFGSLLISFFVDIARWSRYLDPQSKGMVDMKKLKVLVAASLCLLAFPVFAGDDDLKASPVEQYFKGQHQLANVYPNQDSKGADYLFYSQRSSGVFVTFSWFRALTKEYVTSSVPLERINIRIDSNAEIPLVEFEIPCATQYLPGDTWRECAGDTAFQSRGPQAFLDSIPLARVTLIVSKLGEPIFSLPDAGSPVSQSSEKYPFISRGGQKP